MGLFLEQNGFFNPYTEEVLASCEPFDCGDEDMNDFFQHDALPYATFKMGRSYCFRLKTNPSKIICVFTVSNDSIRIYDLPRSRRDYMLKITHHQKRLNRYPGILIGRIGVNKEFARKGVGSEVLDFVKEWFADDGNKSGCRFVIVDAVNTPEVLTFYQHNGFEFLFTTEQQEEIYTNPPKDEEEKADRLKKAIHLKTRIMYFDLLTLE